jgi:hypothetical protein
MTQFWHTIGHLFLQIFILAKPRKLAKLKRMPVKRAKARPKAKGKRKVEKKKKKKARIK